MIRQVEFRDRHWQIVDENQHTDWVIGQLAEGWEADTFDTIDRFVDGGVFVDVGAWIGMMSLYAAPKASHVYAIEPDPVARGMLVRNLDLNGVTNVTVIDRALWWSEGMIRLAEHDGLGSSMTGPGRTGPAFEVVSMTPHMLWNLIQPERIDLVKVDTEGSEKQILPGLIRWPCPIHLSIHGDVIDAKELDFEGRPVDNLDMKGYPFNWTVLVGAKQ